MGETDRITRDVVDVLSATGGVPKYLEEIRPSLSSDENITDMLPHLHVNMALLTSAAPYRIVTRKKGEGCQIDLLIQSKRFWYVVEIKRKRSIGREVIDEVERKVLRLPHPKSVSIRTALVYEGELSKAVEGDGYFDAIVPIEKLLMHSKDEGR